MKEPEDIVIVAVYGLLGAFLGFLVFVIALGGFRFVFLGRVSGLWRGPLGLIICLAVGGGLGLLAYKYRHREFGSGGSNFYDDEATAMLFTKRLMVIGACLAGLYFIWQLAKGL